MSRVLHRKDMQTSLHRLFYIKLPIGDTSVKRFQSVTILQKYCSAAFIEFGAPSRSTVECRRTLERRSRRIPSVIEMFSLTGRVAIITGSASGFGRATAKLFAEAGASVVLASRRADKLQIVADEIAAMGGNALVVPTDVSVEAQVKNLAERTLEGFGQIDVLVNNAGILTRTPVPDTSEEEWYALMDANLKGPFLCCKHVLPVMLKKGRGNIVNIASYLGQFAGSGNTPIYGATKGGVIALTKALAVKYGPQGIRANAVAPAFIKTDLNRDVIENDADPVAKEREVAAPYPLKRLGKPEDIAAAALYFASDASDWVTGAVLMVDGGLTAA